MSDPLYVLTDGGRARLVERNAAGDFATVVELDHRAELRTLRRELRTSPPPRSFEGQGGSRHAVGLEGRQYLDQSKMAFMDEVAEAAARRANEARAKGVVIAAPARLLEPLRERIQGQVSIVGSVSKDLVKTPDHELGRWLEAAAAPPGS